VDLRLDENPVAQISPTLYLFLQLSLEVTCDIFANFLFTLNIHSNP